MGGTRDAERGRRQHNIAGKHPAIAFSLSLQEAPSPSKPCPSGPTTTPTTPSGWSQRERKRKSQACRPFERERSPAFCCFVGCCLPLSLSGMALLAFKATTGWSLCLAPGRADASTQFGTHWKRRRGAFVGWMGRNPLLSLFL